MSGGLTVTGFSRPILTEIAADILADERGAISAQLSGAPETITGNLNIIFADQIEQAWEVVEEAINGMDPQNATDSRLVALALLTGIFRRSSTKGLATVTLNLDAGQSYAIGALAAHVLDEPDNRWLNRDAVTSVGAGNYSAVFEAEDAGLGSAAASGTLTVIATPVSGWNSVTNAADAVEGTEEESIEDLRARRQASLSLAGSGTVDAIRADVLQVTGVLQVLVNENTTDVTVGTLTPHSFQVVVWDGATPAAANNDIAQAIHDTRPAGIPAIGVLSGNATTSDAQVVAVKFDRATQVPIYVSVDVVSALGVAIVDVQAAIINAQSQIDIGDDVIIAKISAAVTLLAGVDDLDFVRIGIAPAPVGVVNVSISATQIATFSTANIVVTGDAS